MNAVRNINSQMLRDYLDRHLGPDDEAAVDEALIENPALVEQLQLEIAMRRGMKEISRRDRPQAGQALPQAATAVQRGWGVRHRRRWMAAAVAALLVLAAIPSWMLVQQRQQVAALEARLLAVPATGGQQVAAYALPAAYVQTASSSSPPLRLRLPQQTDEIVLELPASDSDTPRRMLLVNDQDPNVRLAVAGVPVADSAAQGFQVSASQLQAGRYHARIEVMRDGQWVAQRDFVLAIEPHK